MYVSETSDMILNIEAADTFFHKKMDTDNKYVEAGLQFILEQNINVKDVIKIAEEAGKIILKIYEKKDGEEWNVEVKSDSSPLTRADKEANAYICTEIMKITPHIPIVSEENKFLPYEIRKNYQYFWCIDPLDGTKEFIKRNGQFTVNIALIKEKEPVMGVVHTPVFGKTHWGAKGFGSYLRYQGSDSRVSCVEFSESDQGLTIVGSASHSSAETDEFVSQFDSPNFTQLGSSLKLLMVAEGTAHIYPRLAPTSEWDTAAAHAIVLEAGGVVLQAGVCDNKGVASENWKEALGRKEPVVYNKQNHLNPFFVVYGKRK